MMCRVISKSKTIFITTCRCELAVAMRTFDFFRIGPVISSAMPLISGRVIITLVIFHICVSNPYFFIRGDSASDSGGCRPPTFAMHDVTRKALAVAVWTCPLGVHLSIISWHHLVHRCTLNLSSRCTGSRRSASIMCCSAVIR